MKIESVEGIVLSEVNYSESSKILNVLTREFGLIGIMSKGCRNVKSKLRGVSRKLIYGTFNIYYKESGVSTLISVDLINSFSKTMMDLSKISYSSFILDLVLQVVRQNNDTKIFELLRDSLIKIEEGITPLVITNIIELKLLEYLGVKPNLDSCSLCGSTKNIVSLSGTDHGFVCGSCYTNQRITNIDTIKMIRLYDLVDISTINKLDIDKNIMNEINTFIDEYYEKYTGLYIKSKDFIKQVNRLDKHD